MRIVLGVTGGIATYKIALLLRLMTEEGHDVHVVPTEAALNFVGKATWEALSGNPVYNDTFEAVETVNHVLQGRNADLVVVAPATADVLARTAAGMAPDLLGNILLTATAPVVFAPAMHTEMWENPATQANVATLKSRGVHIIEPAVGRLTGKDSGKGRLPEPDEIWDAVKDILATADHTVASGRRAVSSDETLSGKKLVISAGGTREAIDPVRFIGNRSSGKQGVALAEAAAAMGAEVTLIAGAMDIPAPVSPAIKVVRIESTRQLLDAVLTESVGADVLIMAAAVSDFRPTEVGDTKTKKTDDHSAPTIVLEQTEDVLATAVRNRNAGDPLPGLIVGFAAETGDEDGTVLEYGRAKLARKKSEMLVVNEVGTDKGFGKDDNEITILFADGTEPVIAQGSKDDVSVAILEQVAQQLAE